MTTYMYVFSVKFWRHSEFVEWARSAGVPFWLKQQGRELSRVRSARGTGASVGVAEFESAEALGRMLDSPEWTKIADEFQQYVTDLASSRAYECAGQSRLSPAEVRDVAGLVVFRPRQILTALEPSSAPRTRNRSTVRNRRSSRRTDATHSLAKLRKRSL